MGWVEPGSGRVLLPPPLAPSVVPRHLYRSKVGVPPSRAEADQALQLARLKALRAEVNRPTRAQLRGLKALVDSDDVLGRWQQAVARAVRVEAQVRLWQRGAGKRAALPVSLSKARDSAANEHMAAWSAVRSTEAALVAALPRPTLAQLQSLRVQVHRDASGPGRLSSFGSSGRAASSASMPGPAAGVTAPGPRPGWQQEYRRLSNLIHEQDSLVASAAPGSAGRRAALAEAARLRGLAVSVRGG